jgi:MCP family monocarboxylic acid transporter-like MFS transporter 10
MLFGSVLSVFSLFMLSLAQPHHYYQVFLSQGIGLGLAIGITYVPSVSVISHYFLRKRALALGIATTGAALGGLIHPILLNQLIYSRLGFRGAVKVSAGLDGVMLLVAFLLMRPQYPAAQSTSVSRISFWKALKTYYAEPPFLLTSLG